MNGYQYILAKQAAWAAENDINLIGSEGSRGRPAYTPNLEQNLFHPLLKETYDSFVAGEGGEVGTAKLPWKMQAVHSSSALGVNVFQYWKEQNKIPVIAAQCGLCRSGSEVSYDLRFEEKCPISTNFNYPPNIDVVIHNSSTSRIKRFAIECKFSEAYGARRHSGLKARYLELKELWEDIPHLYDFAQSISPDDNDFVHLHPAQLVKHILGLTQNFGLDEFRLLYLWYDVLGEDGFRHRSETEHFAKIAKKDGIKFQSMTYQELIIRLFYNLGKEHREYLNYLVSRYL